KAKRPLLLFITTNDERMLPTAFMRRCVVLELDPPDEQLLVTIAQEHYGADTSNIYSPIAQRVLKLAADASASSLSSGGTAASAQNLPSTAEYLDTVRACLDLNLSPTKEDEWKILSAATLWKRQTPA